MWLNLTNMNGVPVHINSDNMVSFARGADHDRTTIITTATKSDGPIYVHVKETPEQIRAQLEGRPAAKPLKKPKT